MSTALTGAAGEHYVAYELSKRGYCVGLSRGGSPFVDIMISTETGEGIAIQVKTSSGAWRGFKRTTAKNHWEFDVGKKAKVLKGDRLFYVFVDLRWGAMPPDIFIVPSISVFAEFQGTNYPRNMFWIPAGSKEKWYNRWEFIKNAVKGEPTAGGDGIPPPQP